jgi:oligoribonuclease
MAMANDPLNLIWIDLEMTGLDTDNDCIIEIATIVTSPQLEILAEGPVLAIHQDETVLGRMDEWNQRHHSSSGLIERVRASRVTEPDAERQTLEFLQKWVPANQSPMCGNSICQDRRFLHRCMPELEEYFHYRNLDVSTVKELSIRWAPNISSGFKKKTLHRALDDIRESIEELAYFRKYFFVT